MPEHKILLVQHEKSPLSALKKALTKSGYEITSCTSAFDALDELRTEPGDLVLSSVKLPDINGYQLCTLIKSGEETCAIPVVVVGDSEDSEGEFWQRAALPDLVMSHKEAESAKDSVVDQIKQLLVNVKGAHKKGAQNALIPPDLDSKDLLKSYERLLGSLLMERSVAHLARTLVEAVSSRVQFMARFSGYVKRVFDADVTGLVVIDPKAHWAIYDALIPLAKGAIEKLQTATNKEMAIDNEVRTMTSGEILAKGGANVKSHHVVEVHDSHNELLGAVIIGWTTKHTLSDEMLAQLDLMKIHMRPVFKALFDLQQIQMLKQHHAFGSYVDPITGLYNIEFLIGFLQQQLLFSSRQKLPTGLILVDVDRFSAINEEHGAETGDMVLMSIGHKLSRIIRQSDLLARYSGDTFAIVLPNTDLAGSKVVAEKLRTEIEAMSWDTVGSKPLSITVCVGCSSFTFQDCNPETILRDAKIALMDAKDVGRNRVSP
ncbi:MAG TPA: diguanylate cyclase [Candidatus Obscuribacterales bacterium]